MWPDVHAQASDSRVSPCCTQLLPVRYSVSSKLVKSWPRIGQNTPATASARSVATSSRRGREPATPPSDPARGGDDLLRERLDLVHEVRREEHEDEVRDASLPVAGDGVQALLLLADHDGLARDLGRRLLHVGDEL